MPNVYVDHNGVKLTKTSGYHYDATLGKWIPSASTTKNQVNTGNIKKKSPTTSKKTPTGNDKTTDKDAQIS